MNIIYLSLYPHILIIKYQLLIFFLTTPLSFAKIIHEIHYIILYRLKLKEVEVEVVKVKGKRCCGVIYNIFFKTTNKNELAIHNK